MRWKMILAFRNKKCFALLVLLLGLICFAACEKAPENDQQQHTSANTANILDTALHYELVDIDDSWDSRSAEEISFDGEAVSWRDGRNLSLEGNTLNILAGGSYILSGDFAGQIVIEARESDLVRLVLNGVSIHSELLPAIDCREADKLIVVLADGSENQLEDAAIRPKGNKKADAALFSKSDLSVNGTGTLQIKGNYKHGIVSKDDFFFAGGSLFVEAENNGIEGKESLAVLTGNTEIHCGGDGMKSSETEKEDKGWIFFAGGVNTIQAGDDGIQAETDLTVENGDFTIKAGLGDAGSNDSLKGIKAGSEIKLSGGNFQIEAENDALHSNENIRFEGAVLSLHSGDDAIHADKKIEILSGQIDIKESLEGIEATEIYISGGNIELIADDDGMNASGERGENAKLSISGGNISIDASGDGVDSNGDISMSDGTLLIQGPISDGEAAIDYDGEFVMTGGLLIAAGSSGMAQMPGENSSQNSLMVYYSETQAANTILALVDENDEVLLAFQPQKDYRSVVISSPELEKGKSYSLFSGGSSNADGSALLETGTYRKDGEKLCEITLDGLLTRVSDTGETVSGFMGGPGGGMPPIPDAGDHFGGKRPEGPPPETPPEGDMPASFGTNSEPPPMPSAGDASRNR